MKNSIILSFFMLIISFPLTAQQKSFVKSQMVEASADDVWERLRTLDGLEDFAPQHISDSWVHDKKAPGVGCVRSCTAAGMKKGEASYSEKITKFSDAERFYQYEVFEGTPTVNMVNSLRVTDLGYKKSMVTWTSTRDGFVKNPQMTEDQFDAFLETAGQSVLNGLASLYASN